MIVETIKKGAALIGWLQMATDGRWRALTPSGYLTHHTTRESALEAILCSN